MRNVTWSLLTLVLICAVAQAATAQAKRVLFIGLDGVRPDALATAETPNIDALASAGAFTDNADIFGERYRKNDTVSGPSWGSILCGVWADRHGLDGNAGYEKYRACPTLFTHVAKARPDAFTAAVATWKPIADHLARGAKQIAHYGRDELTATAAAKILSENDPEVLFVHLDEIDGAGHRNGFHPTVKQYVAAIEHIDGLIGKIVDAAKNRENYESEDWLIVMTTDHGGKGKGHAGGRNEPEIRRVFLLVSGPSAQRGEIAGPAFIVDAPATVLAHLGVQVQEKWKLDGRPIGLKPASKP